MVLSTHKIITKKIIDLTVDFLKENVATNRLYGNTKVSDRFAYDSAMIPCVIIRQTSNTQKRIHYDDFIDDWENRVQLLAISGDNNLVGNNVQRVNLPMTVDWNPTWAWDTSIPIPSGSDITQVIFSSGTPPPPLNTTDITTGIIITIPPPSTFIPTSIERALEGEDIDPYTYKPVITKMTSGTYNLAIGLTNQQYYLIYSGTGMSGIGTVPIKGDDYVINPSGMPEGTVIKMNDVLFAGDQYVINTYADKQFISETFGGMYDITVNFDVYAMSTIECQELCDAIQRFLVEKKKDLWNKHGLSLTSWTKGGESEEAHMNEYIFKASLTTQGFVEWHNDFEIPLISAIESNPVILGFPIPLGVYVDGGRIYNELHTQTGELSGTRISLLNYSPAHVITSASGNYIYPASNSTTYPEASGSGWYLSGNSIYWTSGQYPDFASVEPSGWVPVSGENYYVNYILNGYIQPSVITKTRMGGYPAEP